MKFLNFWNQFYKFQPEQIFFPKKKVQNNEFQTLFKDFEEHYQN